MPAKTLPHVVFQYAYALEGPSMHRVTPEIMESHLPPLPWCKPRDGLQDGMWSSYGPRNTEKLIEGMYTNFQKMITRNVALYINDGWGGAYCKFLYGGPLMFGPDCTDAIGTWDSVSTPGVYVVTKMKAGIVMELKVDHTSRCKVDVTIMALNGEETKLCGLRASMTLLDLCLKVKKMKKIPKNTSLQFVKNTRAPCIKLNEYNKTIKQLFPAPVQQLLTQMQNFMKLMVY